MAKETLLQRAKKVPINKRKIVVTDEHIELALAWLRDEVALRQMNIVLMKPNQSGNVLYGTAVALREAYRRGKITIK